MLDNLDLIRVHARFVRLDGVPAQGSVTFTPSTILIDHATNEIVGPVAITGTLDFDGRLTGPDNQPGILLPATDDPDLEPQGWTYKVDENITGVRGTRSYNLALPHDAVGGEFDLSDVATGAASTPGTFTYVVPASVFDDGNAIVVGDVSVGGDLDVAGSILVDGVPFEGGGGAVDSVNGETGVVVLGAADVGADVAGAAASAQAAAISAAATDATTKADAAEAAAIQRANHTGTQPSTTISDFAEAVQDAVASLLGAGSNITLTYDDENDELTITSSGGGTTDPEAVRDAIGVALVGVGPISILVDDAGDTITVSTTATVNSTDASLRDRTTHTGVQAIATVTGLQTALDAKLAISTARTTIRWSGSAWVTGAGTGSTPAWAAIRAAGLNVTRQGTSAAINAVTQSAWGAGADSDIKPGDLSFVSAA